MWNRQETSIEIRNVWIQCIENPETYTFFDISKANAKWKKNRKFLFRVWFFSFLLVLALLLIKSVRHHTLRFFGVIVCDLVCYTAGNPCDNTLQCNKIIHTIDWTSWLWCVRIFRLNRKTRQTIRFLHSERALIHSRWMYDVIEKCLSSTHE